MPVRSTSRKTHQLEAQKLLGVWRERDGYLRKEKGWHQLRPLGKARRGNGPGLKEIQRLRKTHRKCFSDGLKGSFLKMMGNGRGDIAGEGKEQKMRHSEAPGTHLGVTPEPKLLEQKGDQTGPRR